MALGEVSGGRIPAIVGKGWKEGGGGRQLGQQPSQAQANRIDACGEAAGRTSCDAKDFKDGLAEGSAGLRCAPHGQCGKAAQLCSRPGLAAPSDGVEVDDVCRIEAHRRGIINGRD